MDVSLQGWEHGLDVYESGTLVENPHQVISSFLQKYDTAKIVFIVDTHCGDNGRFIYKGHDTATYDACSLLEVFYIIDQYFWSANMGTDPSGLHPT